MLIDTLSIGVNTIKHLKHCCFVCMKYTAHGEG